MDLRSLLGLSFIGTDLGCEFARSNRQTQPGRGRSLRECQAEADGQLRPTMKVRRQVIMEQYTAQSASLYGESTS